MTPTPGQIAYTAYCEGLTWRLPWAQVAARQQQRWEAAAQAVLKETAGFTFALGQRVRRDIDPEHVWEIWWRSCREERDRTFLDYGLKLVDPTSDYHPSGMSDGTDLSPAEDTRDVRRA